MALQNFLVLGLIPGTNIQISFTFWLATVLVLILAWEVRRFVHSTILAAISMKRALSKAPVSNLAISEITL